MAKSIDRQISESDFYRSTTMNRKQFALCRLRTRIASPGLGTIEIENFLSQPTMKRILSIGAIALGLAVLTSGCSLQSRKITGIFAVLASGDSPIFYRMGNKSNLGAECSGADAARGFGDIDAGGQVLIKDASGKLIATGSLGKGAMTDLGMNGACVFSVAVNNVPHSDFYTIEVGSNRKGITYSAKELQEKGWKVELSLGS